MRWPTVASALAVIALFAVWAHDRFRPASERGASVASAEAAATTDGMEDAFRHDGTHLGLPKRAGPRPRTTPSNPHTQLDQNPPLAMYEALAKRLFALESVVEAPSGVSVPGARALLVAPAKRLGPADSFMIGREFAHLHPVTDGSLHASVPPEMMAEVMDNGWAEIHPVALRGLLPMNIVMLYGPRDEQELDVIMKIVEASRARAIP